MNRKLVGLIALLVIAALAALWWFTRSEHDPDTLKLYGNVDIRQVSLAFDASERVQEMRVDEGDSVHAGEVLAVLDTRTTALQLAQAQAQVGVAEQALLSLRNGNRPEEIDQADARVRAAQAEAGRSAAQLKRLEATAAATGGSGVSQQDLDNARAQLTAAQAQLEAQRQSQKLAHIGPRKEDIARAEAQLKAAEAQRDLLQHQLDLAQLKAPQDAIVRARLLEPGDMASPSRPAYTLALVQPKWIRAYVDEPDLGRIRSGMSAQVTLDSAPDAPIGGTIGYISSVAEFTPKSVQTEELRTDLVYEIRVRVADPEDRLRLGMPATVRIDLTQSGQASRDTPPAAGSGA